MLLLAVLSDAAEHAGYPTLALLVGLESMGVPLPGETALIAASVLAGAGHLNIVFVIAIAAAAAIIGDNCGYVIGRHGGRALLARPGPFEGARHAALEQGDRLFASHGGKAVFFGRWVSLLRIWAAWLAGATHMPWPRFLFFNAAGGICWAVCFGLLGYFGGRAAAELVGRIGVGAALALAIGVAIGYSVVRVRR
jgi:membrane protein DedA with SNARE-associated domain